MTHISRSVQRSANGRLVASTTRVERVLPNEEVSLASRPDMPQMNLSAGTESASANAEADVDTNSHHANNNDLDTQAVDAEVCIS